MRSEGRDRAIAGHCPTEPTSRRWQRRAERTGVCASTVDYFVGDWDGDSRDFLALRRGNKFYVCNTNATGAPVWLANDGREGDEVLVGDWNGDRKDTFAVRRGFTYHVKNTMAGGNADIVLNYGRANDVILVGDWDGNRSDTLGVVRH